MEETLRDILSEVLAIDEERMAELTIDSDLIDFGLDSLKAIEMVVSIEDTFNIAVSDDDLIIDNMNTLSKIVELVNKYTE